MQRTVRLLTPIWLALLVVDGVVLAIESDAIWSIAIVALAAIVAAPAFIYVAFSEDKNLQRKTGWFLLATLPILVAAPLVSNAMREPEEPRVINARKAANEFVEVICTNGREAAIGVAADSVDPELVAEALSDVRLENSCPFRPAGLVSEPPEERLSGSLCASYRRDIGFLRVCAASSDGMVKVVWVE